jgi:hypothetical protein
MEQGQAVARWLASAGWRVPRPQPLTHPARRPWSSVNGQGSLMLSPRMQKGRRPPPRPLSAPPRPHAVRRTMLAFVAAVGGLDRATITPATTHLAGRCDQPRPVVERTGGSG